LARRTAESVKAAFPTARILWGFSNTTFYHCPVEKLPPGIDGQSYHPYGTGTQKFDGKPKRPDQPSLEGFVPSYEVRLPEGILATFIQTECLIRLLNPLDRLTKRPPGASHFFHYMTEHGVLAEECGVKDDAGAWQLKSLCASRSFLFWLNKGIDALHYFDAYEKDAKSFGLLPPNLPSLPGDAKFESVATPPMRVVRNIARVFQGGLPLSAATALRLEVTALDPPRPLFAGDANHPPLTHRDGLTVLPFQLDENRFVIACYVQTRDALKPIAPERYRFKISGIGHARVEAYDPHEDQPVPVESVAGELDTLHVVVPTVAHPRLLVLQRPK
jgi:hypothetical protein